MLYVYEWQFIFDDPLHMFVSGKIDELSKTAAKYHGQLVLARDEDYALIEFETKQDVMAFLMSTGEKGTVERNPHYDTILDYQKTHRVIK
jgi:hypothetical protein